MSNPERDTYGLRVNFPKKRHTGFADDADETKLRLELADQKRRAISSKLELSTTMLRDKMRRFDLFNVNIRKLQAEIFIQHSERSTEESGSKILHERLETETQQLSTELKITDASNELINEMNTKLLEVQSTLSRSLLSSVRDRLPRNIWPDLRLQCPTSACLDHESVGVVSPAIRKGTSSFDGEIVSEHVRCTLRDGDQSAPPFVHVWTSPGRIINFSKLPRFHEKRHCYVSVIDPDLLQALGIRSYPTTELVKVLSIPTYSRANPDGAQYVTPSHKLCYFRIPTEAIIMRIRLDVFYFLCEKMGIVAGNGALLDTLCTKKLSVEDFLDFYADRSLISTQDTGIILGPGVGYSQYPGLRTDPGAGLKDNDDPGCLASEFKRILL